MGIEYIHIDSRNRSADEFSSKTQINLSNPITKAVSVEVSSFSVANELYNVVEGNNTLQIITQDNASSAISISKYTVNSNFYTIDDMLANIQAQIDANGGYLNNDANTRLVITHDSITDKVHFTFSGSNRIRACIYYPDNDGFHNSIAHRMGFSRSQIINTNIAPIFSVITAKAHAVSTSKESIGEQVLENTVTYDFAIVASSTNKTLIANHLGFETYSHLFINSDLVNNFQTNMITNGNNTVNTSILEKINISVNRSSWIHYDGLNQGAMSHNLNGRTISSFWVSLNDSQNHEFKPINYKDYCLTLKFTTKDDHELINETAIQSIHDLMYKIKYNC